jgi:GAF domain-containing protein
MLERGEAVCLSDVDTVADWKHFMDIGDLRSRLGVPLTAGPATSELLSLGRLTHSPFSPVEKDTAQVFAGRIAQSLENRLEALGRLSPVTPSCS